MISLLSALSALLAVLTDEEEFDSPYDAWKDDPYAILDVLMRQRNYVRIFNILGSAKFKQYIMDHFRKEIEEFNKNFDWSIPHPIEDFDFLRPGAWWFSTDSDRSNLIDFCSGRPVGHAAVIHRANVYINTFSDVKGHLYCEDQIFAPGWAQYTFGNSLCFLPKINCNEKVYFQPHVAKQIIDIYTVQYGDTGTDVYFIGQFTVENFVPEINYSNVIKTMQNNGFTYLPPSVSFGSNGSDLTNKEIDFVFNIEPLFDTMSDKDIYDHLRRYQRRSRMWKDNIEDNITLSDIVAWRKESNK